MHILNYHSRPDIEKLKAKKDLDKLVKALNYKKDQEIRKAAVRAIRDIRGYAALPVLLSLLAIDKSIRKEAIITIRTLQQGSPLDVNYSTMLLRAIRTIYQDLDSILKEYVAIFEPRSCDLSITMDLEREIRDGFTNQNFAAHVDRKVRNICAWKEGSVSAEDCLKDIDNLVIIMISMGNRLASFLVNEITKERDAHVQRAICEIMGKIGDISFGHPLIDVINNERNESFVRNEAINSLMSMQSITPAIFIEFLGDRNIGDSLTKLYLSNNIKIDEKVMAELLSNESPEVRVRVALILGIRRIKGTMEKLLPLLDDRTWVGIELGREYFDYVNEAAAYAIGKTRDQTAKPLLLDRLRNAIDEYSALDKTTRQHDIVRKVHHYEDDRALSIILDKIILFARVLGGLKAKEAVAPLLGIVAKVTGQSEYNDEELVFIGEIFRELGGIGDTQYLSLIENYTYEPRDRWKEEYLGYVIEGLENVTDPKALEILKHIHQVASLESHITNYINTKDKTEAAITVLKSRLKAY